MKQDFKDHFGQLADTYLQNRPLYPETIFEWIAALSGNRQLAWDCGTGNGQAAIGLADYFDRVIATDASEKQISNAIPHERIEYRTAVAERSGLASGSVDVLVVAQALHWFDFDKFFAEAQRVLSTNGVFVALSYGVLAVDDPSVDLIAQEFYYKTIGDYWPPERKHVETGYADIPFPFTRIEAPVFSMEALWGIDQLIGYFRSWSAVGEYKKTHGVDPTERLEQSLRNAWGESCLKRSISWPLTVLAGRR